MFKSPLSVDQNLVLSPDSQRLLVMVPAEPPDDASVSLDSGLNTLKVVFNWFTELNEKVPTKN